MATTLREIEARLTGPGGPFETVEEPVLGEPMRVFRDRRPSLRALLEDSLGFGDAEYLVCEGLRLSFAEHHRRVASVARALAERYGVGPGDRVAILAANGPEWVLTWWATVSLGAVAVGLNGWWAGDEIRFGLADCAPRVLVADRRRLARLDGADPGVPVVEMERDFEALLAHAPGAPLPDVPIAEDDPATILYTSGTTGRPKGAVNTHRGILASLQFQLFHGVRMALFGAAQGGAAPEPSGEPSRPCMLVTTPLFHVSGLYTGTVTAMATGLKTVWTRGRFDAGRVLSLIERERVTSWGAVGTMLHRVAAHPDRHRYDVSSVRQVGSGGAPVPPELQERMRELFPNARASVGLGYGLTESTSLVTAIFGPELEERPDSVGRPLPTLEIAIRDADGRPLPDGEEGEIWIRGPTVMKEYWRRPEATREAIAPGRWLRTGDLGRLEEGYLFVRSRRRDLILRGGENVYPVEIEHCLEAHPGVREAAVLGVDHPELGQEVKAVVVPEGGATLDAAELEEWVGRRLARFKVPSHWELRTEPLPRNAAGKVLKPVLEGGAANPFVEE